MNDNGPTTTDLRMVGPLDLEASEKRLAEAFPGPGVETLGRANAFRHAARELVPALVAEVKRLRSVLALTEKGLNRARGALLALKEALDP